MDLYVALPGLRLERLSPYYKRRPKADGKGRKDLVFFFEFMRRKDVKRIIRVIVEDNLDPPHSDKAIEQALEGLEIEIWDWRRPDLSSDTILMSAPGVSKISLYWSGNNAVLRSWSEPEGLCLLEKLNKVELNVKRIKEGELEELDLVDEPVEKTPKKSHNKRHEWLECMDAFSDFIENVDESLSLPEPIKVALIDDGVDASVSTLGNRIMGGKSHHKLRGATELISPYYTSTSGHGTVMASLICRLCPKALLYVVKIDKVLGENGENGEDDEVGADGDGGGRQISAVSARRAIKRAIAEKVHIIFMPWNVVSTGTNAAGLQDLRAMIEKASRAGILLFTGYDQHGFLNPGRSSETDETQRIFQISEFEPERPQSWREQPDFILPGYDAVREQSSEGSLLLHKCQTVTGTAVASALGVSLAALVLYCVQLGALQIQSLNLHNISALRMNRFQDLKSHTRMRETLSSIGMGQGSDTRFIQVWNIFGTLPRQAEIGRDGKLNIVAEIAGKLTKGHKDRVSVLLARSKVDREPAIRRRRTLAVRCKSTSKEGDSGGNDRNTETSDEEG
ncbi:hypothetical protein B0J14DRAFT_683838 [Halenospora varia]|nr:hypothetical protein B0J14DRAFT_683838 [Halenospora varia]